MPKNKIPAKVSFECLRCGQQVRRVSLRPRVLGLIAATSRLFHEKLLLLNFIADSALRKRMEEK